jgi:rhomboid protease GluP
MDGDIDYSRYSAAKLVEMIPRIDRENYPRSYENAWRALRDKWPEAPDDLGQIVAGSVPRTQVPAATLADGGKRFTVRFWPSGPPVPGAPPPNNLDLAGEGLVEVRPQRINFIEAAGGAEIRRKWIERAQVANVEWSAAEAVLTVRTLRDDRYVTLWLYDRDDAAALAAMLPVGLTPEFRRRREHERTYAEQSAKLAPRQRVTPALIGINVLVFVIMACFGAGIFEANTEVHTRFGSNYVAMTWTGEPWRLLTSAFIHFGVFHLAFNMAALWYGGVLCERLYGSARFLTLYLVTAVAGSVVSGWWDSARNSAGASGAVFGVYGALLLFFSLRWRDIPIRLLKRAGWGAVLLVGYSLLSGFSRQEVDNAAHVGGLLCGMLAGLLLARPFHSEARMQPKPGRVAAVVAVICCCLAALSWPLWAPGGARTADHHYLRAAQEFVPAEAAFIEKYVAVESAVREGKLTQSNAGQQLEQDLIPAWQKIMEPFRAIPPMEDSSSVMAQRLALMKIYGEARESGMRLQAEAWLGKVPHDQAAIEHQWARMNGAVVGITNLSD